MPRGTPQQLNYWPWYATNQQPMKDIQKLEQPTQVAHEILEIPLPISPPITHPQETPPQTDQKEEEPDLSETLMETLVLNDYMMISMPENIEKKI